MPGLHTLSSHPSHVMAVFEDGLEAFDLPEGATLVDLAKRIESLSAAHGEKLVAIKVQLESPRQAIGGSYSNLPAKPQSVYGFSARVRRVDRKVPAICLS